MTKRSIVLSSWVLSSWAVLVLVLLAGPAHAANWAHWRGPYQNGFVPEKAVLTSFSQEGENLQWKAAAEGRTTPIVLNGMVYGQGPVGKGESLHEWAFCLDARTGDLVWGHHFNVFLTDIVENRVGWPAPVGDPETGNVYVHGTGGELYCFSGADGKVLWKQSLTETFGRISGYGGRIHTPFMDEDRVVIAASSSSWGNLGRPLMRYFHFDKETGALLNVVQADSQMLDTTYSCAVTAVIEGKRLIIGGGADGRINATLARTGEPVWNYPFSRRGINCSVVVDGHHVYALHSEENLTSNVMGAVVCLDARKTGDLTESGVVWRREEILAGYASPAFANGRLYVVDNSANLFCLDGRTGEDIWQFKLGRVGKGSPVVTSDGVIYVAEVNGRFLILRDAGDKCEVLDIEVFKAPDGSVVEIYGSPAVADGRVYFMGRNGTFCLGVSGKAGEPVAGPVLPRKTMVTPFKPGKLLVTPAEAILGPGQAAKFTARLYDVNASSYETPEVTWNVAGARGALSEGGTFTAAADNSFSAGLITAKIGDQTATARIRISPRPPFKEDFESYAVGSVPPGWLGVFKKTQIAEQDGSKVLQKLAVDPSAPFMRIEGYATPPIAGGYTMVVDLLGTPKGKRFIPEMGVVNSRYYVFLHGNPEETMLRISSWAAIPRVQKDVPFEWKTDTWYRMKVSVEPRGAEAVVRGKVWPRDEKEPAAWSIELIDPFPNTEGSPALYAYSPGTTTKSKGPEVFFDNLQVIPHETSKN